MALSEPTTTEVADDILSAIEAELSVTLPLLPKSFSRVLAKALAGVVILLYKYSGWALLQEFAQHASYRDTVVNGRTINPLKEWGRLSGVGDPNEGSQAQMSTSFQVLNADSSTLSAGTSLVHPSSGVVYVTLTSVVLDSATKFVSVLAASDPGGNNGVGAIGNRALGDVLEFSNPPPQVSSNGATVLAVTVAGVDPEDENSYRARIVERFRARPQGGAFADYAYWAKTVNGIVNVYPYKSVVPGGVDVFVEASVATSNEDGIPTLFQLADVTAAIENTGGGIALRRPVGANVIVAPIVRQPFDVIVYGLAADNPAATKTAIEDAVDDYLRSRSPFVGGLTPLPRADRVTAASVAGVVTDAAAGQGGTIVNAELQINGTAVVAYTLAHGQKAKLGLINFV